ncbi:MAG TPA: kelch repeat-containing protein [Phycisphaerales bacterium]|nr:kelch repeat-containing protein [Phycisphaerales bacterium]
MRLNSPRTGHLLAAAALAASTLLAAPALAQPGPCAQWLIAAPANAPSPRSAHGMAYDAGRNVVVLFGGIGPTGPVGDTWEYDGSTWVLRATSGPPARPGHAMVYDSARALTVVLATPAQDDVPAQTWEWNGVTWTFQNIASPPGRHSHAMAFDSVRNRVVLFGGALQTEGFVLDGSTWEYDGVTWTLVTTTNAPTPRWGHVMTFDSARGVTVLYGGADANGESGETWEYNGIDWTLRAGPGSGPGAFAFSAMAFDSVAGVSVLHNGRPEPDGGAGSTWAWNGATWSRYSLPDFMGNRSGFAMTYDPDRARTVLFGGNVFAGEDIIQEGDTWELRTPGPTITQQPAHATANEGGFVSFTVSVADAGANLSFQWRHEGVPLSDGGAIFGATTSALTINPVSASHAGTYDVVVTDDCGQRISDEAVLTVGGEDCPADFNGDGLVTTSDISSFLGAWFSDLANGTTVADFNSDGLVTTSDISSFLGAWFGDLAGGC